MSDRPTEIAKSHYDNARGIFDLVFGVSGRNEFELRNYFAGLSRALSVSSRGDEAMATALRAIYLKLEDIDKKLVLLERAKR